MSEGEVALGTFLDKWRARWPEWRVAEAFVPVEQRERALAWFALRQELTDAAWGGSDPRPGEAKLGWWAEELRGWAEGHRRHPLGRALQPLPAPWPLLAACLPALMASRARAADTHEAASVLEPFAEGVAGVAGALFESAAPAPAASVVVGLLGERLLCAGEAAVPLQALARAGTAGHAVRDWAGELLQRWPPPHEGSRPGRVHAALVRERLCLLAAGRSQGTVAPVWRVLLPVWRAARG